MPRPVGRPKTDVKTRILAKISKEDRGYKTECWIWPTVAKRDGYCIIQVDYKQRKTYKVAYEIWVGEVPEGLHLDHLCRQPACCNPEHLEPVTHAENQRRRRGIFCKSGEHWMMGDNVGVDLNGCRHCLECKRIRNRELNAQSYYRKKTRRNEMAEALQL